MDDLLCTESVVTPGSSDTRDHDSHHSEYNYPTCPYDPIIFSDSRVLDNLVTSQPKTQPSNQFLQPNKSNITPNIRTVLVNWMLELCEHRACEDQVFLTAVNLLDRFLDVTDILRSQLQLTACACLLLASKIRQCTYMSVETLAYYTEDSVTVEEIKQWEVLILAKLSWNVCPVISFDFVEPLLNLIPRNENFDRIRSHSYTYITLAATDSAFVGRPPSSVAAAAVLSAVEGFSPAAPHSQYPLLERFSAALHCSPSEITPTKELLETAIQHYVQHLNNMNNNDEEIPDNHFLGGKDQIVESYCKIDGKITPTDISDVQL